MLVDSMFLNCGHTYTFAVIGLPKSRKYERDFASRDAANDHMYKLMNKFNLRLEKMYDDKHCKTYVCTNGVRFYVNRF